MVRAPVAGNIPISISGSERKVLGFSPAITKSAAKQQPVFRILEITKYREEKFEDSIDKPIIAISQWFICDQN